jgi:cytochrome P450
MRAVFGVHDEGPPRPLWRSDRAIQPPRQRGDRLPFLRRNLGPLSPWAKFLRARAALDEFIYEEIELRRAEVEAGGDHDDVLSLLLAARHEDGSPMSDEELRDELVTVLGAGHETTATASPGRWSGCSATRPCWRACASRSPPAEDDYLEATVKETACAPDP